MIFFNILNTPFLRDNKFYSHIKWLVNNFNKLSMEDKHLFSKNIILKIEYNGIDKVKVIF